MAFVALITLFMLLQLMFFMMQVGSARDKGELKAPAVTGDEYFERCSRVHMNTIEQLVIALPAMWVCAYFFRHDVAAVLGAVFIIGRFIYSAAYRKDPGSRGIGFMIGFLASTALILCGFYAIVMRLI